MIKDGEGLENEEEQKMRKEVENEGETGNSLGDFPCCLGQKYLTEASQTYTPPPTPITHTAAVVLVRPSHQWQEGKGWELGACDPHKNIA